VDDVPLQTQVSAQENITLSAHIIEGLLVQRARQLTALLSPPQAEPRRLNREWKVPDA